MFHTALLEPYRHAKMSGRKPLDLGKVLEDAEEIIPSNEYLPHKIHDSARKRRKGKVEILYWIEWAGYPEKTDYTWEPYSHLSDSTRALELLQQFHQKNPGKLRHPEVRGE